MITGFVANIVSVIVSEVSALARANASGEKPVRAIYNGTGRSP